MTPWTVRSLPGPSVHGDSLGKNTEQVAVPSSRGIFPTQGSNPSLPNCKQILYPLSHQGNPPINTSRILNARQPPLHQRSPTQFLARGRCYVLLAEAWLLLCYLVWSKPVYQVSYLEDMHIFWNKLMRLSFSQSLTGPPY